MRGRRISCTACCILCDANLPDRMTMTHTPLALPPSLYADTAVSPVPTPASRRRQDRVGRDHRRRLCRTFDRAASCRAGDRRDRARSAGAGLGRVGQQRRPAQSGTEARSRHDRGDVRRRSRPAHDRVCLQHADLHARSDPPSRNCLRGAAERHAACGLSRSARGGRRDHRGAVHPARHAGQRARPQRACER